MGIVNVNPRSWNDPAAEVNVVQVDSDARSERAALKDIDDWAVENGFAMAAGYFPRLIVRKDRTRVYRAACYRLTEKETHSNQIQDREQLELLERMPRTLHRVEDYRSRPPCPIDGGSFPTRRCSSPHFSPRHQDRLLEHARSVHARTYALTAHRFR